MVFESIVVDVLNRFLGDYVENLNRSQLKLGIWGGKIYFSEWCHILSPYLSCLFTFSYYFPGDVVLENLILKQNALEELNIPVQTVYGHLGLLSLFYLFSIYV